jgi:hypothetical protein
MKTINEITRENFQSMFNLKDILDESVFYPAAGIDASDIECLSNQYSSFIHVDYSTPRDVIEPGMRNHFEGVGYDLIGIKHVSREELTPMGFMPNNFTLNDHERQRLEMSFINDRFNYRNFTPFALWAVYELNPTKAEMKQDIAKRFSLLHIGGEACATFEALYIQNKINPTAIAIISPGEGYGDNWTIFINPQFRLYQNLSFNSQNNNAKMPNVLLTNMEISDDDVCFWPEFRYYSKIKCNGWQRIYKRN